MPPVTLDPMVLAVGAGGLMSAAAALALWVGFKWGARSALRQVQNEVADVFVTYEAERAGKRRKVRLK